MIAFAWIAFIFASQCVFAAGDETGTSAAQLKKADMKAGKKPVAQVENQEASKPLVPVLVSEKSQRVSESKLVKDEKEELIEIPIIRTIEKVSGEVTSIEPSSLSVLYETTADAEYEMMIPLTEGYKLVGYKKVSDIKLRDVVDIEYEKVVENPDTDNMRISKNIKFVTFVKHAPEATESEEKAVSA